MNIREELEKIIQKVVGGDIVFTVAMSDGISHGDYASNVFFPLSKKEGTSPLATGEKYLSKMKEECKDFVSHIELVAPGFLNFYLYDTAVREESKKVGHITTKFSGKKILVEHSSPNLFKPFSVGHLMNNIVGEFVTRGMRLSSSDVKTLSFPSDVSLGIAKALMIVQEDIGEKDFSTFFSEKTEDEQVKYLGECYVRGVKACEESVVSLTTAKDVLDKLYNLKDDSFYDLVVYTKNVNERYFKKTLREIGSSIDGFIYERDAGHEGKKIVIENTGDDKTFKESEGAIVYIPSEERKDINTSVFINSQGYPTYEAKDLGLLYIKQSLLARAGIPNFFPEFSFFITDAEQIPHFKVVFSAASDLNVDDEWSLWLENSRHHVPHGRMLFKGQKMSSRLGGVPLALDVIAVVEEEVKERTGDKIANLSQEEKGKLAREIALSALRVAVLRSKPGLNINFDPETSLSFEGDSGPYLLYTHARCFSLLEKGKEIVPAFDTDLTASALERTLLHFNETLKGSIENIAPQKLVTYLFLVAQEFNSFYGQEQILSEDVKKTAHNLAIVSWTKEVLKQGLYVLGIQAVDVM